MKKALTFVSVMVGGIMLASAQTQRANLGAISDLLNQSQGIVTRLPSFLMGIALLVFFWFLIKFISKGGEDAKTREESLKGMGYSVIALFVMVSIWGIVALLGNLLGVGSGGTMVPPSVAVPGN